MPIEWTDDLSVGVELIDQQHRELFERINRLLGAMKCVPFFIVEDEEHGAQELTKTMDFLQDYVVYHFGEEERRMTEDGYPGYQQHKEERRDFMGEVAKLRTSIEAGETTEKLLVRAQKLLVDWTITHIRQVDAELGKFLKAQG